MKKKKLYSRTRHSLPYNTAHALCMPDNTSSKDTLGICINYWFPITTMVARTHLNVRCTYIACLVNLITILQLSKILRFWEHSYIKIDCSQAISKPVWHIPLLCVQWKTPDDGHRNCPKHVEFYSKNKFGKFMHLVDFIIRIYDDARSPERQKLWEQCW